MKRYSNAQRSNLKSRSPRGERGLKPRLREHCRLPACRSPRGERGLKHMPMRMRNEQKESLPSRFPHILHSEHAGTVFPDSGSAEYKRLGASLPHALIYLTPAFTHKRRGFVNGLDLCILAKVVLRFLCVSTLLIHIPFISWQFCGCEHCQCPEGSTRGSWVDGRRGKQPRRPLFNARFRVSVETVLSAAPRRT